MARRARRRSMEQEMLNNNMEGDQNAEANPGPADMLTMATLITALRAATQINQPRRQQIKAPKYDGIGDVEQFIASFHEIATTNEWTNQETLIHLRGSLSGKAQDCGKGNDIETLLLNLRTTFGLTIKQARDGLEKIKKKSTQSFREYGKEIKNFVEIAYPTMAAEDQEDIALDKFLRNTNNQELRKHLCTSRPADVRAAVTLSDEFMSLESESKTRISAVSEEQNMLLETLKIMQNTLKEISTGSSKTEDNSPPPPNQSYMPPGQQMMYRQPMLPGQQMMPQLPFNHQEFYGQQDNRMYMPGGYTGHLFPSLPQQKNPIKKTLSCFQCGGPHLKRNCPKLNHGANSHGNSQPGKTQMTLNSQGPPQ